MMENAGYKKFFMMMIVTYFIYVGACATIVAMLVTIQRADFALGKTYMDAGWYVGMILAPVIGFGLSGLGIIFSIVALTAGKDKPELAKGLGIACFVFFIIGLGAMAGGSIAITVGLSDVIYCAQHDSSPAWRLNCQADIIYDAVIIACMIATAGISAMGILGTVKAVTYLNKTYPRGATVLAQGAVQQQGSALLGGQGKFCSACGAQNDASSKFCKNCAKPFKE